MRFTWPCHSLNLGRRSCREDRCQVGNSKRNNRHHHQQLLTSTVYYIFTHLAWSDSSVPVILLHFPPRALVTTTTHSCTCCRLLDDSSSKLLFSVRQRLRRHRLNTRSLFCPVYWRHEYWGNASAWLGLTRSLSAASSPQLPKSCHPGYLSFSSKTSRSCMVDETRVSSSLSSVILQFPTRWNLNPGAKSLQLVPERRPQLNWTRRDRNRRVFGLHPLLGALQPWERVEEPKRRPTESSSI